MTSRSRQRPSLRSDFDNPPIIETTKQRIQNAVEYCRPPINWSLVKAAEKAGISRGTSRG